MAWFQHQIGMFDDQKIKRLRRAHGMTGYGLWCFILEQIGKEGMKCYLPREYTPEDIGIDSGLKQDDVLTILKAMAKIGLIQKDLYDKEGIICVPQFHKYYDEYHSKLRKRWKDNIGTSSGHHREKIPSMTYKIDRYIDTSEGNYKQKDNNNNNDNIGLIELAMQDPALAAALEKIGVIKKDEGGK